MTSRREEVRYLIKLSSSWEEADEAIGKYMGYKTIEQKYAFLQGLFDFSIIGGCDGPNTDVLKTDYIAALSAIVGEKWR
jgi:hypothetical protein